ncbi:MAG TPA: adenosylcobinamide amidohydrolase [Pseudonocardiaceae bacterium]|nr:adenosylcobinamide amidohydrolase [Pseudonocardiaceae bacterium]
MIISRHVRDEDGRPLPYWVWRFSEPRTVASTASSGGGVGDRSWLINAQVAHDYARHDQEQHATELASAAGLDGAGTTMFTAADVNTIRHADDNGVRVWATVGLTHPTWAAAPDDPAPDDPAPDELAPERPGTINIVAVLPVALAPAALLNALCTATEAKSQALIERGIPATGTPSDAVTVVCPAGGPTAPFCGPRSPWGARLARAVYATVAVITGAGRQ